MSIEKSAIQESLLSQLELEFTSPLLDPLEIEKESSKSVEREVIEEKEV